ncbi:hypothetical protein [Amycolatopsis sp. cmx-4-68]|uniref:hypothetical protein n=1 Tax=Amycolatopsis sp. cmx-4-68 TaxID=2790938 RepID=UPI00397AF6A4
MSTTPPADAPFADAVAAVRARRSAEELKGRRPPSGQAFLRSGMEQRRRFERRYLAPYPAPDLWL